MLIFPLNIYFDICISLINNKDKELKATSILVIVSLLSALSYLFVYGLSYWLFNYWQIEATLQFEAILQILMYAVAYFVIWAVSLYLLAIAPLLILLGVAFHCSKSKKVKKQKNSNKKNYQLKSV